MKKTTLTIKTETLVIWAITLLILLGATLTVYFTKGMPIY